jgi:hypothetical protein
MAVIRLTPLLEFLLYKARLFFNIYLQAFRHPWKTTVLDRDTGRVIPEEQQQEYGPESKQQ